MHTIVQWLALGMHKKQRMECTRLCNDCALYAAQILTFWVYQCISASPDTLAQTRVLERLRGKTVYQCINFPYRPYNAYISPRCVHSTFITIYRYTRYTNSKGRRLERQFRPVYPPSVSPVYPRSHGTQNLTSRRTVLPNPDQSGIIGTIPTKKEQQP